MRFPCEYIASTMLPSLRIRIAHELRNKGKSQNEIAKLLGVKQPVVVSYLHKNIAETGDEKINHHLDALSESISTMLFTQESLDKVMRTICTKCKSLRVEGPLCSIHKTILPQLEDYPKCDICSGYKELPSLEDRSIILSELKAMFTQLSTHPTFYKWIPEIGSQLAQSDEKAKDLDDIASYPGRIIKVKEKIVTVSDPEFGSSKTMSSLLLWLRDKQSDIHWVLSFKNKPELFKKIEKLNIPYLSTDSIDSKWEHTLILSAKDPIVFNMRVLLDSGSSGYEAIGYIFARNSEELLDLVNKIFI
ncbi:MAG: thiamine-phosphate synthase family protein [Candidatus Heimdallarchaeaceae archaeon]